MVHRGKACHDLLAFHVGDDTWTLGQSGCPMLFIYQGLC